MTDRPRNPMSPDVTLLDSSGVPKNTDRTATMTSPVPTIQSTGGSRSCFSISSPPAERPRQDTRKDTYNRCAHADCKTYVALEIVNAMMRRLRALLDTRNTCVDCKELISVPRKLRCENLELRFDALEFRKDFPTCHGQHPFLFHAPVGGSSDFRTYSASFSS